MQDKDKEIVLMEDAIPAKEIIKSPRFFTKSGAFLFPNVKV